MLSKVGNKAIAFINHKFMHPGNLQNLEKVWAAEEKEKQRKKRDKELLEQRNHEVQIEELRKALREKERQQEQGSLGSSFAAATSSRLTKEKRRLTEETRINEECGGLQKSQKKRKHGVSESQSKRQRTERRNGDTFRVQSIYKEDVFSNNHRSVWGSYFDRDEKKWGYACCKELARTASCSSV